MRGRHDGAGNGRTSAGREPGMLAGAIEGLLASFGVDSEDTQQTVEVTIAQVLSARGHDRVEVVGLRWGELTVAADRTSAQLLRFDLQMVHEQLRAELDDCPVERIRIVTR
jgi:hypothetical protein